MSMLGKVDPKAGQVDTATVDLTGPSKASRCAGFLFNKTTAVGTAVTAAGAVALKGIFNVVANNAASAAKAVIEVANPFLPTCPLDSTICGLMPDAVAEATGFSTAVKVGAAVAGVIVLTAGVVAMKMKSGTTTAPAETGQPLVDVLAREQKVNEAKAKALELAAMSVEEQIAALAAIQDEPTRLLAAQELKTLLINQTAHRLADIEDLAERAVQLQALPEEDRDLAAAALAAIVNE
jgi:hypothetical protein